MPSARREEGGLKWSFDKKYDIFWAYTEGGKADADELADGFWVEFDERGNVIGVEIHQASKVLGEYWKDPESAALRALEIAKRLVSVRALQS